MPVLKPTKEENTIASRKIHVYGSSKLNVHTELCLPYYQLPEGMSTPLTEVTVLK